MIECLILSDNEEMVVHKDYLEKAIRPSVPHTLGPGKWSIDIGDDRFVDFSPELSGLQVTFIDGIEREIAEKIASEVNNNLRTLTGVSFHIVWLS
jgi:hypothetical protein